MNKQDGSELLTMFDKANKLANHNLEEFMQLPNRVWLTKEQLKQTIHVNRCRVMMQDIARKG